MLIFGNIYLLSLFSFFFIVGFGSSPNVARVLHSRRHFTFVLPRTLTLFFSFVSRFSFFSCFSFLYPPVPSPSGLRSDASFLPSLFFLPHSAFSSFSLSSSLMFLHYGNVFGGFKFFGEEGLDARGKTCFELFPLPPPSLGTSFPYSRREKQVWHFLKFQAGFLGPLLFLLYFAYSLAFLSPSFFSFSSAFRSSNFLTHTCVRKRARASE